MRKRDLIKEITPEINSNMEDTPVEDHRKNNKAVNITEARDMEEEDISILKIQERIIEREASNSDQDKRMKAMEGVDITDLEENIVVEGITEEEETSEGEASS